MTMPCLVLSNRAQIRHCTSPTGRNRFLKKSLPLPHVLSGEGGYTVWLCRKDFICLWRTETPWRNPEGFIFMCQWLWRPRSLTRNWIRSEMKVTGNLYCSLDRTHKRFENLRRRASSSCKSGSLGFHGNSCQPELKPLTFCNQHKDRGDIK